MEAGHALMLIPETNQKLHPAWSISRLGEDDHRQEPPPRCAAAAWFSRSTAVRTLAGPGLSAAVTVLTCIPDYALAYYLSHRNGPRLVEQPSGAALERGEDRKSVV